MTNAEFKRINKFSKKLLGKDKLKKINQIQNIDEKTESLKYLVTSTLKVRYLALEKEMEELGKASFVEKAKLSRIPHKINIFKTTYSKEDFENVINIFHELEKHSNNV